MQPEAVEAETELCGCGIGTYLDYASSVEGLCKFVKSAYPDLIGATSPQPETAEILMEKNRRNYRLAGCKLTTL